MEISRLFLRVVFPDSRELKWSCPVFLFKSFPLFVTLNLFAMALFVFIFIPGSRTLTNFFNITFYKLTEIAKIYNFIFLPGLFLASRGEAVKVSLPGILFLYL